MELQSDAAGIAIDGTAGKAVSENVGKKAKQPDAKRDEGKQRPKRKVRPSELNAPQYQIRTTVVRKKVKVGDQGLARMLERQWLGIHHSLYYVTVFAPTAIGGRIVNAANVGIREYIEERLEAAERMLMEAQSQASDAAIQMGAPGQTSDHVVEISSQIETDVLAMVRAYDDYLVVMDSLWIGREILDDKRDGAHKIVKDDIGAMSKLLSKLRSKLITYRREKGAGSMTKTEEAVVLEVEDIIIESLSKQAQEQRLKERERLALKAKKREEAGTKGATKQEGVKVAGAENRVEVKPDVHSESLEVAATV
jgi:hypothetical protein